MRIGLGSMIRTRLLLVVVPGFLVVLPERAVAQDACRQWGLKKDPCHFCMLRRYYGMLERNPNDRFPMLKLRKCRSVANLTAHYEKRARARPNWYAGQVILGHLYVAAKKLNEAAAAYRKAAAISPTAPHPHYSLGHLLRRLRKFPEALAAYEKAAGLAKESALKKKVLRSLIDLSVVRKEFAKARGYFRQLLKLEPKNTYLRGEFARMLTRHTLYAKALAEYELLIKQAAGNNRRKASWLKETGEVYEKMGKDPEAIATYRKAMRLTARGHWLRRELTEKIIAIYRRKNDIRSLVAYYTKAWRHRGFFEWRVLAQLYDELGDQDEAIKAYRKALSIQPSAVDTRDKLTALLERAGRHGEALKELERQVRLAPGEPRYQIRLAEKYHRRQKRGQALALLRKCGRRFPSDGSVHMTLADMYTKWGKLDLALKEFMILVRIEPSDHGHLIALGEQYWQRGKKALALATWKRMLRPGLFRTRQEAYATLAGVYADHSMAAQSIAMYKKALRLEPKNPALYRAMAPVLRSARQYDEAVSAWQKVIRLASSPSQRSWRREARTSIIGLWHAQGRLRAKLGSYRSKFEAAKPDMDAGYFLGEAYLKLRSLKDAERVFQKIIGLDPQQHEALLALEEIYSKQFRLDKAVEVLKKLVDAMPNRAREFYMRMAEYSLLMYKDEVALQYVKKALELGKDDPHAWARIASIYERKEDYQKSISAYKMALKLRPRFFKVHFALAKLYMRQGEHAEAARLYHEVVTRSPDPETVARAGKLAVDLDEYLNQLREFERELIPLAFTYTHKPIYRRLLVEVYARLIPDLVRRKRYGATEAGRERARQDLTKIGQRALKPLLEALSSKSRRQQLLAVDLLGHLGNRSAALTLVRLALDPPGDDDTEREGLVPASPSRPGRRAPKAGRTVSKEQVAFQVKAILAAGRLAEPRTAPYLVKLLGSEEVSVREAAVWALTLLGSKAAVRPLLGALDDTKVGVQALSCLGLGLAGGRHLDALVRVTKDHRRRLEVRAACAYALGLMGDRKATLDLISVLSDGRSDVQLKTAWALGMLSDPAAIKPLARIVWSRRGRIAAAVRWALLRSVMGERVVPDASFLKNIEPGSDGRIPVLAMIRRMKPRVTTIPPRIRIQLVKDHGQSLAAGIARALKRHRDLVIGVLQQLDSDPRAFSLGRVVAGDRGRDDKTRRAVLQQSAKLVAVFEDQLVKLCAHPDPDVRSKALSVLSKTGSRRAAALLGRALGDEAAEVRHAALRSVPVLVRHRPEEKPALVRLLTGHMAKAGWLQQRLAAIALGQIGALKAVPLLIERLDHPNGFVAEAATAALGRIGDRSAVRPLARALVQGVHQVRLAAARSLGQLGGRKAVAALKQASRSDPLPSVRSAAAKALSGRR